MPKLILDLCGGTGAWSKPYRDKGYDVRLITLPQYDVNKIVVDERYLWLPRQDSVAYSKADRIPLARVHGILAAPPCTEFSLANTRQTYALRPNWQEGLVTVEACERIIRACMAKGYTKFWALENPFGHLRKFLGVPRLTFEAWWYDAEVPWAKRTDLWGYFTVPKRLVADEDRPARLSNEQRDEHRQHKEWYKPVAPEEYAHLGLDRAAIRAITPSGFAQAFARANR